MGATEKHFKVSKSLLFAHKAKTLRCARSLLVLPASEAVAFNYFETGIDALMYKTLLPRMNASPYRLTVTSPQHSSLCSMTMFIFSSRQAKIPVVYTDPSVCTPI
eukprot:Selendium_serpulae@DN2970_c0_g1_i3.p1